MRTVGLRVCLAVALVTVSGTQVSVFAQLTGGGVSQGVSLPAPQPVRRLTVEEAVQLAAQNNLGISIARIDPLLEDLTAAQVRTAWSPALSSNLSTGSTVNQNTGFLSGAAGNTTTDRSMRTDLSVTQLLPWGGDYSIGWNGLRSTSDSLFTNFSPQIRSGLALGYSQPLLRNFRIDNTRQQLLASEKSREIADLRVSQTLAATSRTVRNAYWDLAFAIASLQVQQQSLELAQENLRNTRARIEIGTVPPIDEVESEAEVAQREEAVIVAQNQIAVAEDALRTLVFNPDDPQFWNYRIEPTDLPEFQLVAVDAETAVRNALERRTDLRQSRTALEQSDINLRYLRNQTLPDVVGSINYNVSGVGGTQLIRQPGLGGIGGEVVGQVDRSFASVLGDLARSDYPAWTVSLAVRYPMGRTTQEVNLARTRLQYSQTQTQLRQQQLQVTSQVRNTARQVQTNQQRVDTSRRARELSERRLEAEQRKLTAGTSTNFVVLQAQRDLSQARNNELNAILAYIRSVVDLETVQEIPLAGVN